MKSFHVSRGDATARVTDVLEAITASHEWCRHSHTLASSDWDEARTLFRRFLDVYEDSHGEEWLGIMESAVVEEMRSRGSGLTVDPATVDRILAWMSRHPNIELLR